MTKFDMILLKDRVYSTSKKIINEMFPDELEYFDTVWEIMQNSISKWKDFVPNKWPIYETQGNLMSRLGFHDISEVPDIKAPIIIGVLAATFWHMGSLKYMPEKEEIQSIIHTFSKQFTAPPSVRDKLKEIIPSLCMDELSNIVGEIKQEKTERSTDMERSEDRTEKFARIWTLKTTDPEKGEVISKDRYEEIMKEEKAPLLIIKSDRIRSIFVNGEVENISPLKYNLLEYLLKNMGHGGDIINLLEEVWKDKERAKKLRKEDSKDTIRDETAHIRGEITSLNKFLRKNLGVEIKSHRSGQYKFTRSLKYYLIEIL